MHDSPLADPERDVRRLFAAVGDEIAVTGLVDRVRGLLLLVGVAWHEPPEPPPRHVHEPGAVDPTLAHPAPEVRRAEVRARLRHRIAVVRRGQPARLSGRPKRCLRNPAGILVGGRHPRPAATAIVDGQWLAAQGLRHLLG